MAIHHTGNSTVSTPVANFRLSNILHVPLMKFNLLSAYQFLKDNHCSLTLDSDGSEIKDRSLGRTLFRGPVEDRFYPFHGLSTVPAPHSAFFSTKESLKTWHKRLGHPSSAMFRRILNKHSLAHSGDKLVSFFCTDCVIGKNHKLSFSSSTSSVSTSLELLHCDVWGPSPIPSVSGYKFYLLIVDEFTKYTWMFPMKYKSEHKGYWCLDIQTQRLYISRHVLFNEEHFPFHNAQNLLPSSMSQGSNSSSSTFILPFPILHMLQHHLQFHQSHLHHLFHLCRFHLNLLLPLYLYICPQALPLQLR
ncbi:hypothetical protein ACFX1X_042815 [Malus domestica]